MAKEHKLHKPTGIKSSFFGRHYLFGCNYLDRTLRSYSHEPKDNVYRLSFDIRYCITKKFGLVQYL